MNHTSYYSSPGEAERGGKDETKKTKKEKRKQELGAIQEDENIKTGRQVREEMFKEWWQRVGYKQRKRQKKCPPCIKDMSC